MTMAMRQKAGTGSSKVWAAKGSFVRRMMTRTQSSAELLILEGALASLLLSHNRDGDCSQSIRMREPVMPTDISNLIFETFVRLLYDVVFKI